MNTELNEPKEMLRRFSFASFILLAVAAFWLCASLVVEWSAVRFGMLVLTGTGAGFLYAIGLRFLRFSTIRETFVMRHAPGTLSPRLQAVYCDTVELIDQMRRSELEPMQRQAMRNRLAKIARSEPKIVELLKDEILSVHPSLRFP